MKLTQRFSSQVFLSAVLLLGLSSASQGVDRDSAAEKQRKLIAILKSDAPPADKAIPCKQLAIYGDKEAVPALAPLLENKDLASWARIALEAIPGPEADEALRNALPRLEGNLLIGAMNSISVRRDQKAVDSLAARLTDANPDVVAAAAAALGNIGGSGASRILSQSLAAAETDLLPALSEGCVLCAERFLQDESFTDAASLYDAVRNKAGVSTQRRLEATRGAILARQTGGLPLLLEQLRSPNRAEFGMGLRTARELKGRAVTEAIGAEMDRADAERQVMLLLALSDRHDEAVLQKLLQAAEKGAKATRIASLGLLDRFGDLSAVPVLLSAAAGADADIAQPAKATLTRMEGKAVDDALASRLTGATGKTRQVIIELAALRRIHAALPAVLSSTTDADPGVRRAAFATLNTLGAAQQVGDLAQLLSKTQDENDRAGIEAALTAIGGRSGSKALAAVLPLAKNSESALREIGLRVLAAMGGPDALAAVTSAINDAEESVQDEAVGLLATWPNNWPEDASVAEPLLNLVKNGRKPAYKIQGARGYLLHLQENKKLGNSDKVAAIERLLPLLHLPQEKRLAVATLGSIPHGRSLDLLQPLADDPALAEESSLALASVAGAKNLEGASKEARVKALQIALARSKNESTQKKAADLLKSLQ